VPHLGAASRAAAAGVPGRDDVAGVYAAAGAKDKGVRFYAQRVPQGKPD